VKERRGKKLFENFKSWYWKNGEEKGGCWHPLQSLKPDKCGKQKNKEGKVIRSGKTGKLNGKTKRVRRIRVLKKPSWMLGEWMGRNGEELASGVRGGKDGGGPGPLPSSSIRKRKKRARKRSAFNTTFISQAEEKIETHEKHKNSSKEATGNTE